MKSRIVVCASGAGTTFVAIAKAARVGDVPAEIVGLISNRSSAPVRQRASELGIPSVVLAPKNYSDAEAWDLEMAAQLMRWRADFVVLAGFLALVGPAVRGQYPQRIINSHPALLPRFGGLGMYGAHVHRAVLAAGATETGITAHTIDEVYDRGPILAQARVPVLAGDDEASLAARVQAREREFYPWLLSALVRGRCAVDPL